MLILTRRTDDAITIGEGIEITVIEIKGNSVRLGVHAPSDTEVHRSEVYVRIHQPPCPAIDTDAC